MPTTSINGLSIRYETYGSGPPILMMAPGGFESYIDRWNQAGVWKEVRPLETLSRRYSLIAYDRREAGESDGRVERLTWRIYADEARALLDYLGIEKAFVLGGCMGCTVATAFGTIYPERTLGLLLHWPTGGVRWRINILKRFDDHVALVQDRGLGGLVAYAQEANTGFQTNPKVGPWGTVIARDDSFARAFERLDQDLYLAMVSAMGPAMFDRDTAHGAEPEELMALKFPALIIPGDDAAHALSASQYLRECLSFSEFCDGPVDNQTAEHVRGWVLDFLDRHAS